MIGLIVDSVEDTLVLMDAHCSLPWRPKLASGESWREDFSSDSLEEKLSSFSKRGPVVFVIEGVFIYLDENEIKKLLPALHAMFPKHKLICDLLTRRLIERYGRTLTENLKELVLLSRLSIIPK